MTLVDAGPLVALFDPRDAAHRGCVECLRGIAGPIVTTAPVLTEVFHLLDPASQGADALRQLVLRSGLRLWFLSDGAVARAFELMEKYGDRPMDFADASLVVAAESLRTTTVFSIDRADFHTYRARIGRSHRRFRVIPSGSVA